MTFRIPVADLHAFAAGCLRAAGLDEWQANRAADVLTYSDARGCTTHGTFTLSSIYLPRLRDGRIRPDGVTSVVRDTGPCVLVDAGRRLGLVAGTEAVDLAVARARRFGIGAVGVRDSTHFGSAGFYTTRAAQAGLLAVATTNCGAQAIAPPIGGSRRLLGTNPVSAAVPTAGEAPFVLDMSTTTVATGKLRAAQLSGKDIPAGWLQYSGGGDCLDPGAYYRGEADLTWLGGRLETGAAKGFGLGILVEMLAGALTGGSVGPSAGDSDDDIGHFFLVIDPQAFVGSKEFTSAADALLETIADSPAQPGWGPVQYPGLPEARAYAESAAGGVALPDHVLTALDQAATDLGRPPLSESGVRA
ncbi:MAG: Ldh family oxidoreductase [Hamadaea sp.]|nr:Ldh family oxidoreductase [Hamadaea sp.]